MIHELDIAVRRYAEGRMLRRAQFAATVAAATHACAAARRAPIRVGPWEGERPMPPAALRVLETTWRVWREPVS